MVDIHPWAKISSKIAESEQFADAANANLLAGVLFAMMLPQTDLYGIIPGNLRLFIGKVCPLVDQPESAIDAALTILHDRGLIVRYEADGKQWVWLPKWNLHQEVRWTRTGPPDYPLPNAWTPPDELVQACANDAECTRPLTRWFRRIFQDAHGYSGILRDTPGVSETLPPRLDAESDAESKNESPASGDAGSEQPKSARKPRAQKPAAEDTPAQAAIRRCYEAVFGAGAVPGGSKYSSLAKLYQEHGEDVFRKLADHIRGREQPEGTEQNAWFAKLVREELSAKWKWIEDTGPDKRRGAFIRLRDGASYAYEADWSFGQQYEVNAQRERGNWNEVTGCTKTPANGFCCDDGYFYPTGQERERWAA